MELKERHCQPCKRGDPALSETEVLALLFQVPGWALGQDQKELWRLFTFKSYKDGVAFLNAVAAMADQEGHHPDMELGYKKVLVRWTTHAVGGLSENDFIGAAKVDGLIAG